MPGLHTGSAIPRAHTVALKGKRLQLLRSPNGTYINQGKMEGASNVGPWRALNLEVPVSFIASSPWFGGRVHFGGGTSWGMSSLSMTPTKWHLPPPPHPNDWEWGWGWCLEKSCMGCADAGAYPCFLVSDAECQTPHLCGRGVYWGGFSLEVGFRAVLQGKYH